jgi:hypothetical protein
MSVELKIKNKHLAEESRIIRFEEQKELKKARWTQKEYLAKGNSLPNNWLDRYHLNQSWFGTYYTINSHRRHDVRNENRATSLARAYLAGVGYNIVEHKRKPENEMNFRLNIIPRVVKMVNKYGRDWNKETQSRPPEITKEDILKWFNL